MSLPERPISNLDLCPDRLASVTDKPYWFRFEPHPQWAPIDVCDNTQMSYDWTVPNVFATSSVTKYTMYAKNASESPPSVIAKSDVFSIQLKPSNSSSSSATPMSTSTSSTPPPTSTDATAPEPWSPGLSTGGKVGIGVGVPAGAALLALTAWFFWGRRRTRPSAERFEKAELDAKTEARIEAGGAEIMEMGGDTHHWAGAASQREPAELCGGLVSHPSGGDTHVVVSGTEGEERGGSESM